LEMRAFIPGAFEEWWFLFNDIYRKRYRQQELTMLFELVHNYMLYINRGNKDVRQPTSTRDSENSGAREERKETKKETKKETTPGIVAERTKKEFII